MQGHFFIIRTLTNLHVGSGDSDFGVVDKQVQRDALHKAPTIHASSLKGALREYFTSQVQLDTNGEFTTHIFGSEVNSADKVQGNYRFLSADLLAIPRPDEDPTTSTAYDLVSSSQVLSNFANKAINLGINHSIITAFQEATDESVLTIAGSDISINDNDFKNLATELPVLARNYLDNGESKNLWYEEFVPRESLFGLLILAPNGDSRFSSFENFVDGKVIQLGANATVGYGLCLFTHINGES
ncbi:MAG: type III-B CRISPR module RAMP protein Cmr4 [Bacteroidota bacterium]